MAPTSTSHGDRPEGTDDRGAGDGFVPGQGRLAERTRRGLDRLRWGTPGRPGLSVLAWLAGVGALLWLASIGQPLQGFVFTTDTLPLAVAEGPETAVLGYVSMGVSRLYLPVSVVATLVVG